MHVTALHSPGSSARVGTRTGRSDPSLALTFPLVLISASCPCSSPSPVDQTSVPVPASSSPDLWTESPRIAAYFLLCGMENRLFRTWASMCCTFCHQSAGSFHCEQIQVRSEVPPSCIGTFTCFTDAYSTRVVSFLTWPWSFWPFPGAEVL